MKKKRLLIVLGVATNEQHHRGILFRRRYRTVCFSGMGIENTIEMMKLFKD